MIFSKVFNQPYSMPFLHFRNKNHDNFKVLYSVIYDYFQADYLKTRLKPTNLGTNINIIPVFSVTRSVNPLNPKFSILKQLKKKTKKKSHLTNLQLGVNFLFSFQLLVAASHKSVILKAFKKFIFQVLFVNRKQSAQLISSQFIKHINSLLRNCLLCKV